MKTDIKPLNEITNEATRLLYRELGVVNTLRFLNQFTIGHGNYTEERDQLFTGLSLDDIISEIKQMRKK
ncbi:MAG: hypothetical protein ACE5HS_16755 [bacterium]